MIIEYMLIREAGKKLAPSWIEDGGYFQNPDDKTLIGWSPDLADRDYYVPDSVVTLTRDTMLARQMSINAKHPARAPDGTLLTDEQVAAQVNGWCEAHGE
jgi:hypothetical protein